MSRVRCPSESEKFLSDFCDAASRGELRLNPMADWDYLTTSCMRAGWDLVDAGICAEGKGDECVTRMAKVLETSGLTRDQAVAHDAVVAYINDRVPRSPRTQAVLAARAKLLKRAEELILF